MKKGFDSKQYLDEQSRYILERVNAHDKLYLEFGGKLIGDFHAMRVLPGFDPDGKVKLLYHLREKAEIIICVYAGDIEQNKIRSDFGITYDRDVFRLIDDLRYWDLSINSVVITRYTGQPAATQFKNKLERRGIKVYTHGYTQGYPFDVDTIVSDLGYGKNDYVETTKPLVVVTAPGPNSGKLATCLNQLYHEVKLGRQAGYAKFETFPIWNLPLKHPVNVAYESATADLEDVNMIDSFHLEKYGKSTVNYNRDIEAFPLLRRILTKINGSDIPYYSPTDMGVNRAGFAIVDDETVQEAAKQEIIRRYFTLQCDYKKGISSLSAAQRGKYIMDDMGLSPKDRPVVSVANQKSQDYDGTPIVAIALPDGKIITGKHSDVMSAAAACVLNCVKHLANLSDDIHLLTPATFESINQLKRDVLTRQQSGLDCKEVLMALSVSAVTNPSAEAARQQLVHLRDLQAHSTIILQQSDEDTFRNLGIMMTSEPEFANDSLFYGN